VLRCFGWRRPKQSALATSSHLGLSSPVAPKRAGLPPRRATDATSYDCPCSEGRVIPHTRSRCRSVTPQPDVLTLPPPCPEGDLGRNVFSAPDFIQPRKLAHRAARQYPALALTPRCLSPLQELHWLGFHKGRCDQLGGITAVSEPGSETFLWVCLSDTK
jgi:hypothetical protein